jgi:hypothetical protein
MRHKSVRWRRLTHNLGWKLASLGLAVLLWLAVVGAPEMVTIQAIPILYRNIPKGLVLASEAPGEIRAELRGPSGKLTQSALAEVFAALDLSGIGGPSEQTFTLSGADFSLPQGVSFLRAVPSQVRLKFDRMASRDVPVQLRTRGAPPEGYRVTGRQIAPDKLRISGPETRVSTIENAETDLIDLGGITQTTEVRVNAFMSDASVQFESPPVVTVKFTLEKAGNGPQ